jgi:DNA polymerase-3 subunit alpha
MRPSAAARDGQPALAITDLNNLFGAIKFYKACRGQGVKPIIGADLWMEPDVPGGSRHAAAAAGAGPGRLPEPEPAAGPGLDRERAAHHRLGEVGLAADAGRRPDRLVRRRPRRRRPGPAGRRPERARAMAQRLAALFPGRFYLELQRAGLPNHEPHVRAAVPLAAELGLPVVATHPVQFLEPDDFDAHEARVCIAEGELLANPKRVRRFTREQWFRPATRCMARLFADLPSALANTLEIARRCNLILVLGKAQLPDFPTPDGSPIEDYFRRASQAGLERRLLHLYPDAAERERQRPAYAQRLAFEIDTIVTMGFPGYFLIVADFISWAKANACPVGPGRGSGAGSLVAYVLSITDLDPLRYQLLFERFLNPDRVSMPDFDIDFCQGNRDRVIDYVKDKYGRDAVSQIATFGTMAAKAALRDVGRVLGMGYGHVDSIAKLIPAPPGKTVTLAKLPAEPDGGLIYARKEAPELEQREAEDEEVAELLALATRVEGITRNIGMHAGGVLIAPGRITDFCPLYQQPGSDSAVSQFDKDDVEAIGLVKFDFLGLATLTILELAKDFIVARRPEHRDFAYENLPLDDPRVYKLFADGLTEAVFQFESRGMQGMLREARPSRFEDLIALVAMYRPGPMENIPTFCARKNGTESVAYPHPLLEQVLGETYGVMVYQEQVMQAAQLLGGYTLGGADLLRRAMGKKKAEEMAKERGKFRAGAADKGIDEAKADEVFDLMEKFAGYGFNKSHAAAYALLAYHTAWIKVHCTAEFYAANMTVEQDDTDKLKVLIDDARLFGVAFEPPDVNRGVHRFEPVPGREGDKLIRYSLAAIKGSGASAIQAIVAAREGADGGGGGPFRSLFDFAARVDRKAVNKRAVEALIKAGAFDAVHADRASLLASVGLAFDWADAQEANALQGGLFDFGDTHGSSQQEPALVAAEPWSIKERLMLEKSALGFFLSGHLFDQSRDEVRRFCRRPIADLQKAREPQLVAGIVGEVRIVNGNRGRLAIFRLDDGSEGIEAVAGEELLDRHREILREDELLIVQGKVQSDRFAAGLRLNIHTIWDLPAARARFGRFLAVPLAELRDGSAPLAELVKTWPARRVETEEGESRQGLPVRLRLRRRGVAAEMDLGESAKFWPSDEALLRWRSLAGGEVRIVYEAG